MSEEQATTRSELLSLTTQIVTAQLSNNPSSGTDVPGLIEAVFDTLTELSRDEEPAPALTPAVPIRRSVTDDYIVCLEDGKKLKMLKRHLMTAYGMTPEQYRTKWGLPYDYPMVAPSYAAKRRELAKAIGLGRKPAPAPAGAKAEAARGKEEGSLTLVTIEVCVENTDGLVAAQRAGADRVELCASLLEGGLTPSWGMIEQAKRLATIPFHVIVRPRGGDFLYSEIEFAAMRADVEALRRLGVAGVVVGCLTAEGSIDETRMRALVEAARPLSVTCHRAFDMTRDVAAAVEALSAVASTAFSRADSETPHSRAWRRSARPWRRRAAVSRDGLRRARCRQHCAGQGCDGRARAALRGVAHGAERHVFRNPGVGMGGTAWSGSTPTR